MGIGTKLCGPLHQLFSLGQAVFLAISNERIVLIACRYFRLDISSVVLLYDIFVG